MKIAINAAKTLTGPVKGTVAIKNETIELRKILSLLKTKFDNNKIDYVDCTVDNAISEYEYVNSICKSMNNSDADLFISIEFDCSIYHNHGGSSIFTNNENMEEALKLNKYMETVGFKSTITNGSMLYKLIKECIVPKSIVFKICCIDNPYDIKKYNPEDIADIIFSAITKIPPLSGWFVDDLNNLKYFKDGNLCVGVTNINDKLYYFNEYGFLQYGFIELADGTYYCADRKSGVLFINEWVANYNMIYRTDENGKLIIPLDTDNGFKKIVVDGIEYTLDKLGCVENSTWAFFGTGIPFYIGLDGKPYPFIQGLETTVLPLDKIATTYTGEE